MANERLIIAQKTSAGAPSATSLEEGEQCWVVPERQMYIKADGAVVAQGGAFNQYFQNTMRVYSYPDGRWISLAENSFGLNTENANESAGTGNDPIREWENKGRFLKKGMKISSWELIGHSNDATNSPEWEIKLEFRYATGNIWEGLGLDNDNEMTSVDIYRGFWKTPIADTQGQLPFTHPINDIHKRVYNLDFTAPEDGYFVFFMRPIRAVGSSGNDYFYADEIIFIKH